MKAEHQLFESYFNLMMANLFDRSGGNAFAQGLHDCATTENKVKHLAHGIQFVDPDLRRNHVVCISMKPISSGTDDVGKQRIQQQIKTMTNGSALR